MNDILRNIQQGMILWLQDTRSKKDPSKSLLSQYDDLTCCMLSEARQVQKLDVSLKAEVPCPLCLHPYPPSSLIRTHFRVCLDARYSFERTISRTSFVPVDEVLKDIVNLLKVLFLRLQDHEECRITTEDVNQFYSTTFFPKAHEVASLLRVRCPMKEECCERDGTISHADIIHHIQLCWKFRLFSETAPHVQVGNTVSWGGLPPLRLPPTIRFGLLLAVPTCNPSILVGLSRKDDGAVVDVNSTVLEAWSTQFLFHYRESL